MLIVPEKFIQHTEDVLNSVNPKIQFTKEAENNHVLPYLDVSVIHDPDGSIEFDWNSKPTSSDRLLHC